MGDASTCFPVSMARAATWDPELDKKWVMPLGLKLDLWGANLFGGVCVNLLRIRLGGGPRRPMVRIQYCLGPWVAHWSESAATRDGVCETLCADSMENGRIKSMSLSTSVRLRELYLHISGMCRCGGRSGDDGL